MRVSYGVARPLEISKISLGRVLKNPCGKLALVGAPFVHGELGNGNHKLVSVPFLTILVFELHQIKRGLVRVSGTLHNSIFVLCFTN